MRVTEVVSVYACTTLECPERLRGFCDEPLFCSVCLRDLTLLAHSEVPVAELNALLAESKP